MHVIIIIIIIIYKTSELIANQDRLLFCSVLFNIFLETIHTGSHTQFDGLHILGRITGQIQANLGPHMSSSSKHDGSGYSQHLLGLIPSYHSQPLPTRSFLTSLLALCPLPRYTCWLVITQWSFSFQSTWPQQFNLFFFKTLHLLIHAPSSLSNYVPYIMQLWTQLRLNLPRWLVRLRHRHLYIK